MVFEIYNYPSPQYSSNVMDFYVNVFKPTMFFVTCGDVRFKIILVSASWPFDDGGPKDLFTYRPVAFDFRTTSKLRVEVNNSCLRKEAQNLNRICFAADVMSKIGQCLCVSHARLFCKITIILKRLKYILSSIISITIK